MENQNEKNPARSVGGEESAPRQSGYGKRPSYRRGSRPGATQSATARNEKREVLSDTETSRAVREDRRSASQSVRGRSMSRSQGQVTVTRSGERKWGDTTGGADGRGRTDAVSDGRLAGARDTSRRGRGTVTDNAGGQSRLQRSEDNSGNEGENLSRNRQNPRSRSGDTRSRQNSAGGR